MAKFGDRPDEELERRHGLGATGKYPHGQLGPHDLGELAVAVAADAANRRVKVDFGKPVAWVSLTPEETVALAELLMAKAIVAAGGGT